MTEKEVMLVYRKAQRHLNRSDVVLQRVIKTVGPCTLRHNTDHFYQLVRSIVSQQISTKAAAAIAGRLELALGKRGITASSVRKASDDTLRAAGLSTNKILALRDLAEKVASRQVRLAALHELSDEEVIESLVQIRGIGRWTAEMFLIFALGRLDVLPVGDLGLRSGVQKQYELDEAPGKIELTSLGEPWRPYRSIATWYFWRSLSAVPQPVI
jgi:DNA-3-methyladenine glycosylase II